jgi:hypothetical protein
MVIACSGGGGGHESASKEEVLTLAEKLRRHYAGQYVSITIFDSREAWQLNKKWLEVAANHLQGAKETPADQMLEKQAVKQWDEHVLVIILPPDEAAAVGLEEIRWTKGERARQHQSEEARKEAEAEARMARVEARKQAQEEARKEAVQKKAEERAASYLRYAKKLIDRDMDEKAKERLQEIVKDMPDTEAAKEAKQLLGELDK